jgi:hypothetical protein
MLKILDFICQLAAKADFQQQIGIFLAEYGIRE